MAIVTLHNRYHEPFVGMYDGQDYVVADKDIALPDYIARHLRRQSIIRDNPISGEADYLLAVLEDGDPVTPVEVIPADTFDRSDTDWAKTKIIPSGVRHFRPVSREGTAASHDVTTKER